MTQRGQCIIAVIAAIAVGRAIKFKQKSDGSGMGKMSMIVMDYTAIISAPHKGCGSRTAKYSEKLSCFFRPFHLRARCVDAAFPLVDSHARSGAVPPILTLSLLLFCPLMNRRTNARIDCALPDDDGPWHCMRSVCVLDCMVERSEFYFSLPLGAAFLLFCFEF